MYQQAYRDITKDSQSRYRSVESEILQRSIDFMTASVDVPNNLVLRVNSLRFVRNIWTDFMKGIAETENTTSTELKASMISIGIFVFKHLDKMRNDPDLQFSPLTEISQTIKKGLET